jgi:hypothetical protein
MNTIIICITFFFASATNSKLEFDSSSISMEKIVKTDTSYDYNIQFYSIGGEQGKETKINMKLKNNRIELKMDSIYIIDSNNIEMKNKIIEVINRMEKYQSEYIPKYECSVLDGGIYKYEIYDNNTKTRTRIEAQDPDFCYYHLCHIWLDFDNILWQFQGNRFNGKDAEKYKKMLDKIKIERQGICEKIKHN